jgi:hypothetical protein
MNKNHSFHFSGDCVCESPSLTFEHCITVSQFKLSVELWTYGNSLCKRKAHEQETNVI